MIQYYEAKKPKEVKKEPEKPKEELKEPKDTEALKESEKIINKMNYSKIYSGPPERTKNESPILNEEPYSITPYEIDARDFGTQEMYGMVTFYLHDDGDLLTDKYEPLDDESIDNYIGLKNLEKLAMLRDEDPELDAYYIRNDRLKIDCEILIGAGIDD